MTTYKVNTVTLVPIYRTVRIDAGSAMQAAERGKWLAENCVGWWQGDLSQDWENSGKVTADVFTIPTCEANDIDSDVDLLEAFGMSIRQALEYMKVGQTDNVRRNSDDNEITALHNVAKELRAIRDRYGFHGAGFKGSLPEEAAERLGSLLMYIDAVTA